MALCDNPKAGTKTEKGAITGGAQQQAGPEQMCKAPYLGPCETALQARLGDVQVRLIHAAGHEVGIIVAEHCQAPRAGTRGTAEKRD